MPSRPPGRPPKGKSTRVSGRAKLFPSAQREAVTRFANWFAALYKASGLEQKDMVIRIQDRYVEMFRADGVEEAEAQRLASDLAIDTGTISRIGKVHQMLAQGDVGFWRVWDLVLANGGDIHDLIEEIKHDRTDPSALLSAAAEEREFAAFRTRWQQLSPIRRAWLADDARRYAQQEREEARLRSTGQRLLDQIVGEEPGEPSPATRKNPPDNAPDADD